MKTFHTERTFRGKIISADVNVTDGGIQIALLGGDRPHIGAVGILNPNGDITVTEFEGHKEGLLCQQWCKTFAKAGNTPAVVSAGIHYENANKEEIQQVVRICGELLGEVLHENLSGGMATAKAAHGQRVAELHGRQMGEPPGIP